MPILNISTVTTPGWYEDQVKSIPVPPKESHVQFRDDPVAMACAVHRAWKTDESPQFQDLWRAAITPQDRLRAAAIRDYYGAKFTEMALRGRTPSEFRLKLSEVLDGRRRLGQSEIGMLYRLPYFYDEDTETDWIYANTATAQTLEYYCGLEHLVQRLTLTPLRQVLRSQRQGDVVRYWWATQHGHPAVISVAKSNSLGAMAASLFDRPSLEVTAQLKLGTRPGHNVVDQYHLELINMRLLTKP